MNSALPFDSLPNIDPDKLHPIDTGALAHPDDPRHPPRLLVLYGSLRERSFSRLVSEEATRLLRWYGCEVRTFNPSGLPLPDDADAEHPKVQELRELTQWSEGMMWVSPERHGAMTGIMKTQIDWIPLALGGVRPDRKSTRLNSSHVAISYAVFCAHPPSLPPFPTRRSSDLLQSIRPAPAGRCGCRAPEGAGAARAYPVVGGDDVGQSRAPRGHDRHHENAD